MPARFILSLDCEGKWGVADLLSPKIHAQLSDPQLQAGYRNVVALLDEFDIPATFAFVGLFGESASDFADLTPELRAIAARSPAYFAPALRDIQEGSGEGWHGNWAVDLVLTARTKHEVALHGVTHIPWNTMTREEAKAELALLPRLRSPVRGARTFVYPRNRVAHADLLDGAGIDGYRNSPPPRSRLMSLLGEFDIATRPESDAPLAQPQAIPAGFFVNWQSRTRRIVPMALSAARAARMMEHAAEIDGIVHFWLHPENVVTAPRTLTLLRKILEIVVRAREAGRCDVISQLDYCRALRLVPTEPADRDDMHLRKCT